MKSSGLIRQNYELTCIGPIHTGSGETLKAFEYLYNSETQEAAFLSQRAWIALLDRHDLVDPFITYIGKGSRIENLRTWLLAQGVTEAEMNSVATRRAKADTLTDDEKDTLNDIICQTTLADGQPYIPGSTIKGALRTGILYHQITREPKRYRSVFQKCQDVLGSDRKISWKKGEFRKIALQLETDLLHTLHLGGGGRRNATASALRGLRVSDAVCAADEMDTVILRKLDATTGMKKGPGESTVSLFRECIPAGRRLTFSITADTAMLKTLGIQSLDEIFAMLRAYTVDGLRRQEKIFGTGYAQRFAEAKHADALLGGGTGFLSKTLIYCLAGSDREAQRFVADFLDQAFIAKKFVYENGRRWKQRGPAHEHRTFDRAISPRTLKLARMDTQDWLMGLCSITGVGNAQTV